MRTRRLLTAAALIALAAVAAFGQTAVVRVREQASVTAPTLTLGDIAAVESGDAALARTLRSISLGASPMPGNWRELERDLFIHQLRRSGYTGSAVQLQCPRLVRVFRASQTLAQAELENRLRSFIAENAPWTSDEMQIAGVTSVGDLVLPQGTLGISFAPRGAATWLGTTPFSVDISVDGQPVHQFVMQAMISVSRVAVVAKGAIANGRSIGATDVEKRRVDISTVRGQAFERPEDVIGLVANGYINAGDVITDSRVARPLVVRRGQPVILEARGQGFIVRIAGVAQQDGRVGDTIRVLNPTSKKILDAEVTGNGAAVVRY